MELLKLMLSALLLVLGLIIGITVNYYGIVFEGIRVHVQVRDMMSRVITDFTGR